MLRSNLRWWLWTCLTFAILVVAGTFGFYGALLKNDITYLGFAVIGLYIVATGWLTFKLYVGQRSFDFIWYIAETMERVGLLGTFIGLAVAFQALGEMAAGGAIGADWKRSLIEGIMTKFYASIVGLVGAMMLKTQIKILDAAHAD